MTAFVPVQVRLVSPMSMGRSATGYPPRQGEAARRERASGRKPGAGSIPAWRSPPCADPCSSGFLWAADSGLSGQSSVPAEPAGSNPAPPSDRCVPGSSLARVVFDGSWNWVIACYARGHRFESGLRLRPSPAVWRWVKAAHRSPSGGGPQVCTGPASAGRPTAGVAQG